MIDKKIILEKLIEKLQLELIEVETAAKSTKDLVTADDLKSEGKYDTRAIEASYLASAQLQRVEEIKTDIQMLKDIEVAQTQKIQMGALALIEYKGNARYYFLTSTSGGTMLTVGENTMLVISVFSPLGNGALGLIAGESFEVETPKEMRLYKIIEVS